MRTCGRLGARPAGLRHPSRVDVVRAMAWRGGSAEWADLRDQVPRRAVERAVRDGLVVRPRPRPGVRLHWADLTDRDVHEQSTSPARTAMDCAATLPFADALAVADGVLREGLLGAAELVRIAEAFRGAGRVRRLRVARAARADAANPFESCLRAVVLEEGLSGFEPQYRVPGTPYVVDLADPGLRVALEADSFRHHGDRAAFRADCRRYDELVRIGWVVLRFAWEDVMFDRPWVARMVCDCCRRR